MAACHVVISVGPLQLMRVLLPLKSCCHLITALLLLVWLAGSIQLATVEAVGLEDSPLRSGNDFVIIRVKGNAYCEGRYIPQRLPRRAFDLAVGRIKATVTCKDVEGVYFGKKPAEAIPNDRGEFLLEFSAPIRDTEYLRGSLPELCRVQLLILHDPSVTDLSTMASTASSSSLPPFGNMLEFSVDACSALQFTSGSSGISSDRVTVIGEVSSKHSSHRQARDQATAAAGLISSYRKLLTSSVEQEGKLTADKLTLGPPDPPQPGDIRSTKKAFSFGPPAPH